MFPQVICFLEICHPTWHEGYIRKLMDKTPTDPFTMDEVQAFHFRYIIRWHLREQFKLCIKSEYI